MRARLASYQASRKPPPAATGDWDDIQVQLYSAEREAAQATLAGEEVVLHGGGPVMMTQPSAAEAAATLQSLAGSIERWRRVSRLSGTIVVGSSQACELLKYWFHTYKARASRKTAAYVTHGQMHDADAYMHYHTALADARASKKDGSRR
jgi:hypothetical protein